MAYPRARRGLLLEAPRDPAPIATLQIAVARQCPKREIRGIAMVAEIEHTREAHRRVPLLPPAQALARRLHEIVDAARHRGVVNLAHGHEGEDRPRGLRGRACLHLGAPL